MAIDPFENQAETPTTETETPTPTKKENTQVETQDQKIVVTLKGGAGYDAPWIVVHAQNAEEAVQTLNDEHMTALLEATKTVAGKFNVGGGGAPKRSAAPRQQGKPQGATQAPNGQTPPEGYEYRTGVSKTGKTWKAFMPTDRNSGLEPIWL